MRSRVFLIVPILFGLIGMALILDSVALVRAQTSDCPYMYPSDTAPACTDYGGVCSQWMNLPSFCKTASNYSNCQPFPENCVANENYTSCVEKLSDCCYKSGCTYNVNNNQCVLGARIGWVQSNKLTSVDCP